MVANLQHNCNKQFAKEATFTTARNTMANRPNQQPPDPNAWAMVKNKKQFSQSKTNTHIFMMFNLHLSLILIFIFLVAD